MTTLQHITLIAHNARRWAKREARKEGFSSDLSCFCARASAQLFRFLKKAGLKPSLILAQATWSHIWIRCQGYLIDITASQFGKKDVVILPLKQVPDKWYWKITKQYQSVEDLQGGQRSKSWPEYQIAR